MATRLLVKVRGNGKAFAKAAATAFGAGAADIEPILEVPARKADAALGLAAASRSTWLRVGFAAADDNPWDLAHGMLGPGERLCLWRRRRHRGNRARHRAGLAGLCATGGARRPRARRGGRRLCLHRPGPERRQGGARRRHGLELPRRLQRARQGPRPLRPGPTSATSSAGSSSPISTPATTPITSRCPSACGSTSSATSSRETRPTRPSTAPRRA